MSKVCLNSFENAIVKEVANRYYLLDEALMHQLNPLNDGKKLG